MEQNKREQFIIRRIGGTTYKVRVVFNESGGETMEDKILRIVRNDMVTNDGTCGIMEAPQTVSYTHLDVYKRQLCTCRIATIAKSAAVRQMGEVWYRPWNGG